MARTTPAPRWIAVLALAVLGHACATAVPAMQTLEAPAPPPQACRVGSVPGQPDLAPAITWSGPREARDVATLDAWCAATGSPVVLPSPASSLLRAFDPIDELVVVSWNLHVGAADLDGLVQRLRAGAFTAGRPVTRFVLLLQEAYRGGPAVPPAAPGMRFPGAIRPRRQAAGRGIVDDARRLGLALYYTPAMRNGAPGETDEDRGNAILSTEPLTELAAIELPFERQRRVAAVATIHLRGSDGQLRAIRLASVHLENTASRRRLRLLAQEPRRRQARALLAVMPREAPLLVGGDFNTWFGYADRTYKAMAAAVPDIGTADRRPTFAGLLRLDHVFSRPPEGWTATATRMAERYGSDHHPILARLRALAASSLDTEY